MNFGESLSTCFSKYANFDGRAPRSEYWWWALFVVIVQITAEYTYPVLGVIVLIGILIPTIAVTARRLHDIDRSGWWQLIGLIPLVGLIVMIYWLVQPTGPDNRFGPAP